MYEKYGINKKLEKWVKFIMEPEAIKMGEYEGSEAFIKAQEELNKINGSEEEKRNALRRLMFILDQSSLRKDGYDEGREKKAIEIAKNMLNDGVDDKLIIKYTKISKKELKEIKEDMQVAKSVE